MIYKNITRMYDYILIISFYEIMELNVTLIRIKKGVVRESR
jgi:hypothetical protein